SPGPSPIHFDRRSSWNAKSSGADLFLLHMALAEKACKRVNISAHPHRQILAYLVGNGGLDSDQRERGRGDSRIERAIDRVTSIQAERRSYPDSDRHRRKNGQSNT